MANLREQHGATLTVRYNGHQSATYRSINQTYPALEVFND